MYLKFIIQKYSTLKNSSFEFAICVDEIPSLTGTGKTLLARAVASQLDCNFLKVSVVTNFRLYWHTAVQSADDIRVCVCLPQVVSSSIVDKYIGESARLIREMFNYARDHQPCIIFMDEIDAIGK